MLKSNIGRWDAWIRFFLGVVFFTMGVLSLKWWGLLGMILIFLGLHCVITVAFGWCPEYDLFHISTRSKRSSPRRS